MADELFISGKTYVSSKKAADESGYAQDYIGQLGRSGVIDAQRVGGLWYVSMDSLLRYKQNSAIARPQPAGRSFAQDPEAIVNFDGKDYISASRASKITAYNQDYVGQLARAGKILSRQVGNRWYVEREGLLAHKREKDTLLAKVQVESVGLQASIPSQEQRANLESKNIDSKKMHFTYHSEAHDLIPHLVRSNEVMGGGRIEEEKKEPSHSIPIRVMPSTTHVSQTKISWRSDSGKRSGRSRKTMSLALKGTAAFTIILVLSYGILTLKDSSTYAALKTRSTAVRSLTASASEALDRIGEILEAVISIELQYDR
ncbi:hypothetical protein HY970_00010 [Candidatus Kaiserbacteria bacterium]|nr:hypothetical protein [Candidatus Kaiserbacteria bacterium]